MIDPDDIAFDERRWADLLRDLDRPLLVVRLGGRVGLSDGMSSAPVGFPGDVAGEVLDWLPPSPPERLGDPAFRADHGVRLAYMTGAMANGIAGEELVVAVGSAGMLASFGGAGLAPRRIEEAVARIQHELPDGPYAFNLIHSPSEEALESAAVDTYLRRHVRTVEASAFLRLTPHIVRYRISGLVETPDGRIDARNKVIAKVSRREIAAQFLSPAPPEMIRDLVAAGLVAEQQARLAATVPLADDITVEADSGGHTDNRPLVVLLPSIQQLRDELSARHRYTRSPRVGAAGGIGTPHAVAAAFAMGAAYVVTGSVNQSCVEAGTSPHVKRLLAEAEFADVAMAPAADMFELGVDVQVLKRGTFFPMRARKLFDTYQRYSSLDEIPPAERQRLERQIFGRALEEVWEETMAYFAARDPEQIARADDPNANKLVGTGEERKRRRLDLTLDPVGAGYEISQMGRAALVERDPGRPILERERLRGERARVERTHPIIQRHLPRFRESPTNDRLRRLVIEHEKPTGIGDQRRRRQT
jgi:trans-AT polyketide synthase, acyltransferase and oxidoreductase domains